MVNRLPLRKGSPLTQFYDDVVRKGNPLLANTALTEHLGTSSSLVGVIDLPPAFQPLETQRRFIDLIDRKLRDRGLRHSCQVEPGRERGKSVLKIKYYAPAHEMYIGEMEDAGKPSDYQKALAKRFAARIQELRSSE